jgi:hypothetical protein
MLKIVIDEFVDKLINHVIIVFLSIKQVSDNWFSTKRKVENSLRTLIEHLVFVVEVLLWKSIIKCFHKHLVCELQQQQTTRYKLEFKFEFKEQIIESDKEK